MQWITFKSNTVHSNTRFYEESRTLYHWLPREYISQLLQLSVKEGRKIRYHDRKRWIWLLLWVSESYETPVATQVNTRFQNRVKLESIGFNLDRVSFLNGCNFSYVQLRDFFLGINWSFWKIIRISKELLILQSLWKIWGTL